jgi:hypothetical protein
MQTWLSTRIGSMALFDQLFARATIDRFATELIQALHEAGDRSELRYDSVDHRILRFRDGEAAGVVNLGNMYGNYRRLPRSGRPAYVRSLARGLLAAQKGLPEEFDLARADLRPKL